MKYGKKYFERYALLSLIKCFDYNLEGLLDDDFEAPDWQSEELDLGIEVTQAISETDGELRSIINRYFNNGLGGSLIRKVIQKKHHKYVGNFEEIDNRSICVIPYQTAIEKNKILESIIGKTFKLNKNYKVFKNNWLYVFADIALYEEDILDIIEMIKSNNVNKIQFDKIFINITDKIFVIDNYMTVKEHHVENELLKWLKLEAFKE